MRLNLAVATVRRVTENIYQDKVTRKCFSLCYCSTALFYVGVSAVYGTWVTPGGEAVAILVFVLFRLPQLTEVDRGWSGGE